MENSITYFMLKNKVTDGTSCTVDSFDKCVNGICRPAGCDNELNSIAKLGKESSLQQFLLYVLTHNP